MTPHKYVCYVSQCQLARLENRLLVRKIVLILMAHVFAMAFILVAMVPDEWQGLVAAVGVGALLHVLWCTVVAWRISRKIQRLKEDVRP